MIVCLDVICWLLPTQPRCYFLTKNCAFVHFALCMRAATPTARQGNPAGGEMQARVVRIDYRTSQQLSHVRVTSVHT